MGPKDTLGGASRGGGLGRGSWGGPAPRGTDSPRPQTRSQKAECAAARQRAQEDFAAVPHSFVFHRGRVGRSLRQLVLDVRRAMEPYTARALKVRGPRGGRAGGARRRAGHSGLTGRPRRCARRTR